MLLLGIITLVMTIPLASHLLSTILIHRFALLILLYGSLLSYNTFYVLSLFTDIMIYEGLNQLTFLLFKISFIEEPNILLTCFVSIMIYFNANTDKSKILSNNKREPQYI